MSTLKRKATAAVGLDAKKPRSDGNIASFFGAPKPVAAISGVVAAVAAGVGAGSGPDAAATESPAARFDKDKWVDGLTDEQKQLLKLEIETLDPSWMALLKDDLVSKEFLDLKRFLDRETASGKKWFPPREDVYSWSRHTPFHTVKVVILGQDPYHNVNQAHGLAFSVRPPTPAPPSLKNMYICLAKDYPTFRPPPRSGGLLTPWADRGVLLLNTCLTVRAHEANSHANRGWERFTQRVIELVAAKRTRGVVFMAWGTPAGKRVQRLDQKRHLVLRTVHPSPLSASRGYFDCGHFRLANEWLTTRYGDGGFVDWSLTEDESLEPPVKGAEGAEKVEGVEKVEKVDKVEKVEGAEKIEKTEGAEKVEKTEGVEKDEKTERDESPEEAKEDKEAKVIKEMKDFKEAKEDSEVKEDNEAKEIKEVKEDNEAKEAKEAKEDNEVKEIREDKEVKKAKEAREDEETKENKEVREDKEVKEAKEAREDEETKEVKEDGTIGNSEMAESKKSGNEKENAPVEEEDEKEAKQQNGGQADGATVLGDAGEGKKEGE